MPTCSTTRRHSTRSGPNAEAGSLFFDLHDPQWLSFFAHRTPDGRKIEGHTTGWRKINVTNLEHPYMYHWGVRVAWASATSTPLRAIADCLNGVGIDIPAEPTFRTALPTQKVCGAILRSAKSGRWVETGAAA
jgi:predicted dehydrogenase